MRALIKFLLINSTWILVLIWLAFPMGIYFVQCCWWWCAERSIDWVSDAIQIRNNGFFFFRKIPNAAYTFAIDVLCSISILIIECWKIYFFYPADDRWMNVYTWTTTYLCVYSADFVCCPMLYPFTYRVLKWMRKENGYVKMVTTADFFTL